MAGGGFNKWMRNAEDKMVEWSRGRHGADELSTAVANVAFVLIVIDLFARTSWMSLASLVLLGYAWFRISSKNSVKRSQENAAAMKAAGPIISFFANPVAAAREQKSYKHLACPHCGQRMRIPRGKGKVRVTCPKCKTRFDGKA